MPCLVRLIQTRQKEEVLPSFDNPFVASHLPHLSEGDEAQQKPTTRHVLKSDFSKMPSYKLSCVNVTTWCPLQLTIDYTSYSRALQEVRR